MEEEKKVNVKKIVAITVIITALLSFLATTYFYNVIIKVVPFGSVAQNYPKLNVVLDNLDEKFYKEFDKSEFEEKIIPLVVNALDDPYTTYMSAEEYKAFNESVTGKFDGIGIVVDSKSTDEFITILSVIKGSPAEKVGLVAGDKILKVDGVEYKASELDVALTKIRGVKGEEVKLTVVKSNGETVEIPVIRDTIVNQSVYTEMVGDIAYTYVTGFELNTDVEFEQQINDAVKNGAKGLIVDLRNNGGGFVDVAVKMADYMLPEGNIYHLENREGKRRTITSDAKHLEIPYVLIVNENTASAAEIMSGAVKDNGAAELVGSKTFGKALIQSPIVFKDGSALKISIERYLTPNGEDINKKGIEPTIKVELPADTQVVARDANDTQFNKALEVLKTKIK